MARRTRAAQKAQEEEVQAHPQEQEQDASTSVKQHSPQPASPKGKGKQAESEEQEGADSTTEVASTSEAPQSATTTTPKQTMDERKERMAELRKKMAQSSSANRKDLLLDKQPRTNNRRDVTNSRKLAKAEAILDERDAKERGEDWERIKNWKYTIEDEERWEEMKAQKEERQDQGVIDPNSHGARSYARTLRNFKPDLNAYKQENGSASQPQSSSSALVTTSSGSGQVVKATELSYGSHTPNDNAIDRVISHLNMEADVREKRHRKRPIDEGADVTYINEKNAEFNRKINRHFDEHTREIRENFERGTAL